MADSPGLSVNSFRSLLSSFGAAKNFSGHIDLVHETSGSSTPFIVRMTTLQEGSLGRLAEVEICLRNRHHLHF
jgi:hypothetical protein